MQYLPNQKLLVAIILINSEISDLAQTIINNENPSQNDEHLRKIKNIIKDNTAILKTHREFFKFHEATSHLIANDLVDCLEDGIVTLNPN